MSAESAEGGRSNDQMVQGAEAVRQPKFNVQMTSKYQRSTVLDNLYPTGNGMSELDRQRRILGVPHSKMGISDDTFEKQLWLRQPSTADLYKTFG